MQVPGTRISKHWSTNFRIYESTVEALCKVHIRTENHRMLRYKCVLPYLTTALTRLNPRIPFAGDDASSSLSISTLTSLDASSLNATSVSDVSSVSTMERKKKRGLLSIFKRKEGKFRPVRVTSLHGNVYLFTCMSILVVYVVGRCYGKPDSDEYRQAHATPFTTPQQ